METIQEMVICLTENPDVLGIVEFGTEHSADNFAEGDYDLFVFLSQPYHKVRSLHFSVGNIPVDLNLRTLDDIHNLNPVGNFDSVLLEGRVVYDPTGQVSQEIQILRQKWREFYTGLSEYETARFRHRHKHFFETLRGRLESAPILCKFALTANLFWLIRDYFRIRDMEFVGTGPGETRTIQYIQEHDPELFNSLQKFYATTDLEEQIRISMHITDLVLEPIGGMWRKDEILAIGDKESSQLEAEGNEVYQALFNK